MDDESRDGVIHDLAFALKHHCPQLKWKRDDDANVQAAARHIYDHLKRCGISFTRKPYVP